MQVIVISKKILKIEPQQKELNLTKKKHKMALFLNSVDDDEKT